MARGRQHIKNSKHNKNYCHEIKFYLLPLLDACFGFIFFFPFSFWLFSVFILFESGKNVHLFVTNWSKSTAGRLEVDI